MKILISPAKSLNFDETNLNLPTSLPPFPKETKALINKLKKYSKKNLKALMSISDDLASLNQNRYRAFTDDYEHSKVAILAFTGDVYLGMEASSFSDEELLYANDHIRILSGLYGILKPLDKIQPYRLEMGTKLKVGRKNNLVQYWKEKLTAHLNADINTDHDNVVINLASNEYFNAIDRKKIKADIIGFDFKEERDGELKFISFNAKKARGMMCNYIVKNKIEEVEDLKGFNYENYYFEESLSTKDNFVFIR